MWEIILALLVIAISLLCALLRSRLHVAVQYSNRDREDSSSSEDSSEASTGRVFDTEEPDPKNQNGASGLRLKLSLSDQTGISKHDIAVESKLFEDGSNSENGSMDENNPEINLTAEPRMDNLPDENIDNDENDDVVFVVTPGGNSRRHSQMTAQVTPNFINNDASESARPQQPSPGTVGQNPSVDQTQNQIQSEMNADVEFPVFPSNNDYDTFAYDDTLPSDVDIYSPDPNLHPIRNPSDDVDISTESVSFPSSLREIESKNLVNIRDNAFPNVLELDSRHVNIDSSELVNENIDRQSDVTYTAPSSTDGSVITTSSGSGGTLHVSTTPSVNNELQVSYTVDSVSSTSDDYRPTDPQYKTNKEFNENVMFIVEPGPQGNIDINSTEVEIGSLGDLPAQFQWPIPQTQNVPIQNEDVVFIVNETPAQNFDYSSMDTEFGSSEHQLDLFQANRLGQINREASEGNLQSSDQETKVKFPTGDADYTPAGSERFQSNGNNEVLEFVRDESAAGVRQDFNDTTRPIIGSQYFGGDDVGCTSSRPD